MKKLFLILIFVFISLSSSAKADMSIFTQFYVRHSCGDPDLNEKNDIFGIVYNRIMYTTFNNSFRKRSYFLGYDLSDKAFFRKNKPFELKIHFYAGLLYGYGDSILSYDGYRLVAAPTIEIKLHKGLALEGFYVPDQTMGTVISVIKYNF